MKPNDLYTLRSKTQFIDSLFVFFLKKKKYLFEPGMKKNA